MCDTFVAVPPATADGSIVFGKNSDRPRGEGQSVRFYPSRNGPAGAPLRCTYITIADVDTVHGVMLSQLDWMWGAEMGANDQGVVIGNEAVWTTEPLGPAALTGMDLVRLGLERGATALQAVDVITSLLAEYGQGGACAEGDPSFAYHNSFLIADRKEAWVLETADRHWAAERVTEGVRNISNGLTIRKRFDRASEAVVARTREPALPGHVAPFDFAAAFTAGSAEPSPHSRQVCGARLLATRRGNITAEVMMEILKDHESGICMHGPFETTASMVSRLLTPGKDMHWFTGKPHPCRVPFQCVPFPRAAA